MATKVSPAPRKGKAAHVALLRAINVGGRTLPKSELVAYFENAGALAVRTFIQSGNVLFSATPKGAVTIAKAVRAAVKADTGMDVPVIVRHVDELRAVTETHPFRSRNAAPERLLVMFLEEEPTPEAIARLDPKRSPGDELVVVGREIYLHLPKGFGVSKLSNAYFDAKLGTKSTGRNWRTVLKLLELAEA